MAGPLAAAFGTAAVLTAGGALIVVLPVLLIAVLPEIRRLGAPAPSQPPEPAGASPAACGERLAPTRAVKAA